MVASGGLGGDGARDGGAGGGGRGRAGGGGGRRNRRRLQRPARRAHLPDRRAVRHRMANRSENDPVGGDGRRRGSTGPLRRSRPWPVPDPGGLAVSAASEPCNLRGPLGHNPLTRDAHSGPLEASGAPGPPCDGVGPEDRPVHAGGPHQARRRRAPPDCGHAESPDTAPGARVAQVRSSRCPGHDGAGRSQWTKSVYGRPDFRP